MMRAENLTKPIGIKDMHFFKFSPQSTLAQKEGRVLTWLLEVSER